MYILCTCTCQNLLFLTSNKISVFFITISVFLKIYITMVLMIKVMIHNTNGQVKLITF